MEDDLLEAKRENFFRRKGRINSGNVSDSSSTIRIKIRPWDLAIRIQHQLVQHAKLMLKPIVPSLRARLISACFPQIGCHTALFLTLVYSDLLLLNVSISHSLLMLFYK